MTAQIKLAIEPRMDETPRIRPLAGKVPKIAIIHDWLEVYAGAEKVLEQLIQLWPNADLFTLVDFLPEKHRGFLQGREVTTSFIQKLPFARTKFRNYLPLMPLAIEQLDLSRYDVIISSSYAVAKGVITSGNQLHVSYVHSPIRYAWDLQHQYLRESGLASGFKSFLARSVLHYIRMWDARTSASVDVMLANSRYIARRIEKCYGRQAEVIYPPVDTSAFSMQADKQDYYVTASRMVPYKMIPVIAQAFAQMPDRKLVIIGDGPDMDRVKAAAGPNVQVLGHQPFEVLKQHMQNAKAFIFAAEEDFGITPVEAQACGTPVIAFGRGGSLETVIPAGERPRATGVFFHEQTPEAIAAAVQRFDALANGIKPEDCRDNAARFSVDAFHDVMRQTVERHVVEFGY